MRNSSNLKKLSNFVFRVFQPSFFTPSPRDTELSRNVLSIVRVRRQRFTKRLRNKRTILLYEKTERPLSTVTTPLGYTGLKSHTYDILHLFVHIHNI